MPYDSPLGERPLGNHLTRCLSVLCVLSLCVAMGCSCSRRTVDTSLKFVEAKAAYAASCQPQLPCAYLKHYELGWRNGYMSVAKGRRACPPALPPQQYWAHKYESPEGRQFVVTWYDGWRAGAKAAKCQRLDDLHRVPAIRSDCDCRSACDCAGSGVLPNPTAVCCSNLTQSFEEAGPNPTPADAPHPASATRLPDVEPSPSDQPTGEVVAPPVPE